MVGRKFQSLFGGLHAYLYTSLHDKEEGGRGTRGTTFGQGKVDRPCGRSFPHTKHAVGRMPSITVLHSIMIEALGTGTWAAQQLSQGLTGRYWQTRGRGGT